MYRHCNGYNMNKMISALKIHRFVEETKIQTKNSNTVKRWEDIHNSPTARAREREVSKPHRRPHSPGCVSVLLQCAVLLPCFTDSSHHELFS